MAMKKHSRGNGKHMSMSNTNQFAQRLANYSNDHFRNEHLENFMDQGSRRISVSNQAIGMDHGCLPQLMNQGKGTQNPGANPMGHGGNPRSLGEKMGQR